MSDAGVGRLLVASLHQGIADLLPNRLDFYESWLNPTGLRDGRIGLAPLAAVLSFLRQEGQAYEEITSRAGEYTAEWTVADLPAFRRTLVRAAPPAVRLRLALAIARSMIRRTFPANRVAARVRAGSARVDITGSLFCQVREQSSQPLCAFYAAAVRRLMHLFSLDVEVVTNSCRATTGGSQCVLSVSARPALESSPPHA
jgi:bacteriochlorophyll 4-vinyl reductase